MSNDPENLRWQRQSAFAEYQKMQERVGRLLGMAFLELPSKWIDALLEAREDQRRAEVRIERLNARIAELEGRKKRGAA